MKDFGLYLVMTDPLVGYARCAEAAVRAGVKMLQLRMKRNPREEIVAVAKTVRSITAGSETRFIVNDDPAIAEECGADGVHLGQDDMSLTEARRLFPSLSLFGLSTHSPAQALAAKALEPDYIGVGPVYATPTKEIPDPVLGNVTAGRMIASVPFPAVAIGGIDFTTLSAVLAAGAKNFAVVRAVCSASDPYSTIKRLQETACIDTPRRI